MTDTKPYGLSREEDLRWESLRLASHGIGMMSPLEIIAHAEVFADYVRDGLPLDRPASLVEAVPGTNIVHIARRPA